jgi:hypothetical protein
MLCHGVFKRVFGTRGQMSPVFVWSMRLFVTMLNMMPLYLMNVELNEWTENKAHLRVTKLMFNLLVSLTLIAYFVASFARPAVIPTLPPLDARSYCQHCRNWKPQRTHHCSICQVCVPKMDHHCPWLGNCVGFHNFKAFFLFCLYQAVSPLLLNHSWSVFTIAFACFSLNLFLPTTPQP